MEPVAAAPGKIEQAQERGGLAMAEFSGVRRVPRNVIEIYSEAEKHRLGIGGIGALRCCVAVQIQPQLSIRARPQIPRHPNTKRYRFANAAIPGSSLPSRNSRLAPPPVLTWLILSARPNFSTAAAESPPPTIVVAPDEAIASATALVPLSKGFISK